MQSITSVRRNIITPYYQRLLHAQLSSDGWISSTIFEMSKTELVKRGSGFCADGANSQFSFLQAPNNLPGLSICRFRDYYPLHYQEFPWHASSHVSVQGNKSIYNTARRLFLLSSFSQWFIDNMSSNSGCFRWIVFMMKVSITFHGFRNLRTILFAAQKTQERFENKKFKVKM